MAFELPLPPKLKAQGWKVKIRDKETVEPPHVTIMNKARSWRWSLRHQSFMDRVPDPREVAAEVIDAVKAQLQELTAKWDSMYPHNPVVSKEGSDD